MKLLSRSWLAATAVAAVTAGLLGAIPAGAAAGPGFIRLAHLSPGTPPVDVYLYSFGDPTAQLVLHHVSYGTVSPYQDVPAGEYTVSMRPAGAAPATQPVLSTEVWVRPGRACTVAGLGPASGLRLEVLADRLAGPAGQPLVRVIQAALRQHVVSVSLGRHLLARGLTFASTTPYRTVTAGRQVARVTDGRVAAAQTVSLARDTTHTLVVLDGRGRLRILDLADAVGSSVRPAGGAATGLGGTAPRPAPAPLPWLAVVAAGALLALAGAGQRFRARPPRRGAQHRLAGQAGAPQP